MTIEEINGLAEQLAKQYNPNGVAPFPYEIIERDKDDLKIFVTDQLGDAVSGAISFLKDANAFYVLINKNKPDTRQNFTIAHELGHYFLHAEIIKTEEALVDSDNSLGNPTLFRLDDAAHSKIETEANNFAASLTMPEQLVRKAWEGLSDVEEVAKIFKVSVSAMSIRLERLGIIK